MDDLPNEIILSILHFLPLEHLVHLNLVNRQFYHVVINEIPWRRMSLQLFHIPLPPTPTPTPKPQLSSSPSTTLTIEQSNQNDESLPATHDGENVENVDENVEKVEKVENEEDEEEVMAYDDNDPLWHQLLTLLSSSPPLLPQSSSSNTSSNTTKTVPPSSKTSKTTKSRRNILEQDFLRNLNNNVHWRHFYLMFHPRRYSRFDPAKMSSKLQTHFDQSYLSFRNNQALTSNCSAQTLHGFIPSHHHYCSVHIWQLHIQVHKQYNISIGISDRYFKLEENFVGYRAMNAPPLPANAPSYSMSSDAVLRNGDDNWRGGNDGGVTYASGDDITVMVNMVDREIAFYKNGAYAASLALSKIEPHRTYYFTVTQYSPQGQVYIVTDGREKVLDERRPDDADAGDVDLGGGDDSNDDSHGDGDGDGATVGRNVDNHDPDVAADDDRKRRVLRSHTYSISILEAIKAFNRVMQRAEELEQSGVRIDDPVPSPTTEVDYGDTGHQHPDHEQDSSQSELGNEEAISDNNRLNDDPPKRRWCSIL